MNNNWKTPEIEAITINETAKSHMGGDNNGNGWGQCKPNNGLGWGSDIVLEVCES